MDAEILEKTVGDMLRVGIIAADESVGTEQDPGTIRKRLAKYRIPPIDGYVDVWRVLVKTTPGIGDYASAIILEESRVKYDAADLEKAGVVPGVKVDKGTKGRVNEHEELTEGLIGVEARLTQYKEQGARFAKWRTITHIDEARGLPTDGAIKANINTQVKYANACQSAGIVPICEPEVLINGSHSLNVAYEVTFEVLSIFFEMAKQEGLYLPGMVLKTSMVVPGDQYKGARSVERVADSTVQCLEKAVPADIGGVVFLSGGQTDRNAVLHLNRISQIAANVPLPYKVTFSYSRATQDEAMKVWGGKPENIRAAQAVLLDRLVGCAYASRGMLGDNFDFMRYAPAEK
jgi:fructose-bisphosphate aldolase class I